MPPPRRKPTVPSLSDVLGSSGITMTGYVAASYYHSTGYNSFHEFDVDHDTFQLDQAGLQIGYQPKEGFGAFVDLLAGEDGRILNYSENGTNSTFNLRQAYVQYAFSVTDRHRRQVLHPGGLRVQQSGQQHELLALIPLSTPSR